jgi:putative membrane protein
VRASELYDHGAQPERTLLAWGRTCLALAVVIALVIKILTETVDPMLIVLTVGALALPVLAWLLAVARYRRVHRGLTDAGSLPPGGGAAVAVASVAVVVCGVLAMAVVLA